MGKGRGRKWSMILLMAVLLTGGIFYVSIPVKAEGTEQEQSWISDQERAYGVRIISDQTEVKAGDIVTFYAYNNTDNEYSVFEADFIYDSTIFENIDDDTNLRGWASTYNFRQLHWTLQRGGGTHYATKNEELGYIKFKALKNFTTTDVIINITYFVDRNNYDFEPDIDAKFSFHFNGNEGDNPYVDPTPAPETGDAVEHLYKDDKYTTPVKTDSINIYANGGIVTENNVKTNYKSCSLYTDILASYKYWTDTKGKYQTATGKVIVGITGSQTKPMLNKKGKIVDVDAAKIASASIKNGRITVTAKSLPGKVYLWVLDTGDVGTYTCCPVTVKSAPSAIYTYATPDITYGITKKYTAKTLSVGNSTDVYIYPIYKDGNTVKKAADGTYTATVAKNVQDYFTVTKTDSEHFVIRATSLKNGKKVTGKVTIQCDQNGKKAVFTVTVKK